MVDETTYRYFLKDLIIDIKNEVPEEKHQIRFELESIFKKLWYKAPEILNHTVKEILYVLTKYIPLYEDISKNPEWVKRINVIWKAAMRRIDEGLEVSASLETISAPPTVE